MPSASSIISSSIKGRHVSSRSFGLVHGAIKEIYIVLLNYATFLLCRICMVFLKLCLWSVTDFFFAVNEVSLLDEPLNTEQCALQLKHDTSLLSHLEHENIVQYFGTDKSMPQVLIISMVVRGAESAEQDA